MHLKNFLLNQKLKKKIIMGVNILSQLKHYLLILTHIQKYFQ